MLEPVETFHFAQFVKERLFEIFHIGHSELLKAFRLSPVFEEPHASIDDLA